MQVTLLSMEQILVVVFLLMTGLTISGVSLLETITFYHASGSSSVELKAVEVDGLILVDGDKLDRMVDSPTNGTASTGGDLVDLL